jgi:hypothetical protein
MSHTPGPWKIFDGWGSSRFSPVIVDSIPDVDGKCVANCICHVASSNDVAEANAHLIAAAPDLLEACEAALECMPSLEVRNWPPGFELKKSAIKKCREAIRKAKGEPQ